MWYAMKIHRDRHTKGYLSLNNIGLFSGPNEVHGY
jgi:hypothetical protein